MEIQRARDMFVGQLDPRGLQAQCYLRRHCIHRWCPPGQSCQGVERRRGIHLEQGQRAVSKTRKPTVDRQHRGVQLPLRLPCWVSSLCFEQIAVL